jgi:serine/threonine protein kinase
MPSMKKADETTDGLAELERGRAPGEPRPGLLVANCYRLLELLGKGGMADVYEAEHVRLGNRVAVKFLRSTARSDPKGVERFRQEARRVASLNSDHIVSVFDCGELPNGTPYLVMERLLGEDLKSLLAREGKLPVRLAVELAIAACRGLSVVHSAGLVHRDLKPANLFVVRSSTAIDRCKILDFGVAKALASDATAGGALLGTVRYMAAEQLEDASSARATADIYAVGAILYECLAGMPPHRGETLQELMFDIVHRDPVPLRDVRNVPAELDRVVMKALARDRTRRFSRAGEMAEALVPYGALGHAPRPVEGDDDSTLDDESYSHRLSDGDLSKRRLAWLVAGIVSGITAGAIALATVATIRGEAIQQAGVPRAPTVESASDALAQSNGPTPRRRPSHQSVFPWPSRAWALRRWTAPRGRDAAGRQRRRRSRCWPTRRREIASIRRTRIRTEEARCVGILRIWQPSFFTHCPLLLPRRPIPREPSRASSSSKVSRWHAKATCSPPPRPSSVPTTPARITPSCTTWGKLT